MIKNYLCCMVLLALSIPAFAQITYSTSRPKQIALTPPQTTIAPEYYKGVQEITGPSAYSVTDAKPHLLIKETDNGYARIRFINMLPSSSSSFWDIRTETFTGGPIPDRYMAFAFGYDDRMIIKEGGNVGIGLSMPSEKLEVNGHVKLNGTLKYAVAQNRVKSFAPTVFHSQRPTTFQYGFPAVTANSYAYFLSGNNVNLGYAVVHVDLPDSAVVESIWGAVWDNTPSSLTRISLNRVDLATNVVIAVAVAETTIGSSAAFVQNIVAASNPFYNVVDNENFAYYLEFTGQQNSDLTRLYGAKVYYSVAKEN